MRVLVIVIALLVASTDDPSKKGRKGNESYRNEQHSEAAQLYREGLDAAAEEKPGIIAGLWNNLGASLFRTGDFQQAKDAFTNAIGFARSEQEMATFAYNTGNTIYSNANNSGQQGPQGAPGMPSNMGAPQGSGGGNPLQEALEYYKQAMLADPNNEDAKYNYEFVKRQLDEQQQNQDQNQENQDQQNQDQNQENQDQQQNQDQNQDQQDQDQQEQQDQQQQNQDQQQQSQDQQQQDQQQQQQQQQQPDPTKLSREEAERILQALQNEEQELLRQVMKPQTRPKKVDKDW